VGDKVRGTRVRFPPPNPKTSRLRRLTLRAGSVCAGNRAAAETTADVAIVPPAVAARGSWRRGQQRYHSRPDHGTKQNDRGELDLPSHSGPPL